MRRRTPGSRVIEAPPGLRGRAVADAMVRTPVLLGAHAQVGDAVVLFEDDHLHAALVVDETGRLLSVVLREDLAGRSPAEELSSVGRLRDRTVGPDAALDTTWWEMRATGLRRLAVVDAATGRLLGLLCLKSTGLGFCSDEDVAARAADPRSGC